MNYYPPIEPNSKKPDDLPVGRIIAIVVLFSIGLWPVAVYLIWKTYTESKRPQKRFPPERPRQGANGKIYGEYRPYQAPASPLAGAPRQPRPNTASASAGQPAPRTTTADKSAPPLAGQPAPRPAAANKPAPPNNTGRIKKPWWHTALGALGVGLIAAGSWFSFLALGDVFGGGALSNAASMFALSAMAVISGGCFLMAPRTFALQEAKKIRFCNVVGTRKFMKLPDMAATLGMTYPQLIKELQQHLDKGLFPGGYIDHARKLLVVSAQGFDPATLEDEPIPGKPDNNQSHTDTRSSMLEQIRAVNERIENASVSQKVQRIEEITALILEAVGRDPAKERKIGAFMGYYLPTTLKILTAYEQFEEQGVRGENLQAAMRDIENILDHLVSGFERQLDLLFENDVLDISSDISVLESMLAKDGLTDNDLTMPKG